MYKKNLFSAVKLYPLNATTNSSSGVQDIKKMSKYFEFLEKIISPFVFMVSIHIIMMTLMTEKRSFWIMNFPG